MNRIILLLTVLLVWNSGFAQIEKEIENFEDVAATRVANGRRLLVKSVDNNDWDKVGEIYTYLNKVAEKEGYNAFTYFEHLYITVLTSQWQQWILLAKEANVKETKMLFPELNPIHDELFYKLKEDADNIREKVLNANLLAEDEAVLLIFIHLNKVENPDNEYNKKIRNFKHSYTDSKYQYFVKTVLPSPRINSSIVYGLGATVVAPNGNLGEVFNAGAGFNMNVAVFFNKLYIASDLTFAGLKSTAAIIATNDDGTTVEFAKGKSFSLLLYNFRFGFSVVNSERVNIAPYVSMGSMQMQSPQYDSSEEENVTAEAFSTFSVGPGARLQFMLSKREYVTYFGQSMLWRISFVADAGYLINTDIKDDVFTGDALYVNGGLVFGFGAN